MSKQEGRTKKLEISTNKQGESDFTKINLFIHMLFITNML